MCELGVLSGVKAETHEVCYPLTDSIGNLYRDQADTVQNITCTGAHGDNFKIPTAQKQCLRCSGASFVYPMGGNVGCEDGHTTVLAAVVLGRRKCGRVAKGKAHK